MRGRSPGSWGRRMGRSAPCCLHRDGGRWERDGVSSCHSRTTSAPDRFGYSFEIEDKIIAEGIYTSAVVWGSEPVTISADEALAAAAMKKDTSRAVRIPRRGLERRSDGPSRYRATWQGGRIDGEEPADRARKIGRDARGRKASEAERNGYGCRQATRQCFGWSSTTRRRTVSPPPTKRLLKAATKAITTVAGMLISQKSMRAIRLGQTGMASPEKAVPKIFS